MVSNGDTIYVQKWVDDTIVTGSNDSETNDLKEKSKWMIEEILAGS